MNEGALDLALAHVAGELRRRHLRFALIGGLGVSIRGEVLSMTEKRPQDGLDAAGIVAMNPTLDVQAVRELLAKIVARGFHRGQDLGAKLDAVLARGG